LGCTLAVTGKARVEGEMKARAVRELMRMVNFMATKTRKNQHRL
jgi:hypothetical protein